MRQLIGEVGEDRDRECGRWKWMVIGMIWVL